MTIAIPRTIRVSLTALAGLALAACTDVIAPVQSPISPTQSGALVAQLTCKADALARSILCAPASPELPGGISPDIIIGGQNTFVQLQSFNVGMVDPDPDVFSGVVQIKNLTMQPMGTVDGVNATPGNPGLKIFFHDQPTNGVTVDNPDGTGTFTSINQPYFLYAQTEFFGNEFLGPNRTASGKTWKFRLHGASTFTFSVYVTTTMPDEAGPLRSVNDTPAGAGLGMLTDVWGTSASDVFVAGTDGSIFHFNGSSWTSQPTGTTDARWGLWGSSASDVWAVGDFGTVQHYNGTVWTASTQFFRPASAQVLTQYDVFGLSANEVYSGGDEAYLHKWNGTSWATTNVGLPSDRTIVAIWGTSASNLYVGGGGSSVGMGFFRHFDGVSWSAVNTGTANPSNDDVNAIWGTSATDIWAAGYNGLVMHFNGTSWTRLTASPAQPSSSNFFSVHGTGANDVWFVSGDGTTLHWNGSVLVNTGTNPDQTLHGVRAFSRQNVYVAGIDYSAGNPDMRLQHLIR